MMIIFSTVRCKLILYADDFALIVSGKITKHIQNSLSTELQAFTFTITSITVYRYFNLLLKIFLMCIYFNRFGMSYLYTIKVVQSTVLHFLCYISQSYRQAA